MRLIKEQIKQNNQDVSIKIPLFGNVNRLGFQQNINEFIERETGLSINPVEDSEKRLFKPSVGRTFNFQFLRSGSYDNSLLNASFTQEEIDNRELSLESSFYIAQYYNNEDLNNQVLLHTSYLNGFTFSNNGESTTYSSILRRNLRTIEFLDLFLPISFLDEQSSDFNIKVRYFFFNGKSGSIKAFFNESNESLRTSSKLFFDVNVKKDLRSYSIDNTGTLNIKELNNAAYRDKLVADVESRRNLLPSPPESKRFLDDGTYEQSNI